MNGKWILMKSANFQDGIINIIIIQNRVQDLLGFLVGTMYLVKISTLHELTYSASPWDSFLLLYRQLGLSRLRNLSMLHRCVVQKPPILTIISTRKFFSGACGTAYQAVLSEFFKPHISFYGFRIHVLINFTFTSLLLVQGTVGLRDGQTYI